MTGLTNIRPGCKSPFRALNNAIMDDKINGDVAFLPVASVPPSVEAPVVALGGLDIQGQPANPPVGGLAISHTGQGSTTVSSSVPVGPSPVPATSPSISRDAPDR